MNHIVEAKKEKKKKTEKKMYKQWRKRRTYQKLRTHHFFTFPIIFLHDKFFVVLQVLPNVQSALKLLGKHILTLSQTICGFHDPEA